MEWGKNTHFLLSLRLCELLCSIPHPASEALNYLESPQSITWLMSSVVPSARTRPRRHWYVGELVKQTLQTLGEKPYRWEDLPLHTVFKGRLREACDLQGHTASWPQSGKNSSAKAWWIMQGHTPGLCMLSWPMHLVMDKIHIGGLGVGQDSATGLSCARNRVHKAATKAVVLQVPRWE